MINSHLTEGKKVQSCHVSKEQNTKQHFCLKTFQRLQVQQFSEDSRVSSASIQAVVMDQSLLAGNLLFSIRLLRSDTVKTQ